MKSITSTKKLLIISAVLALSSLAVSYILFSAIRGKSEHISTLTNDLNQSIEKQSRYLAIKNGIEKTKSDLATIDSYFVPEGGEVGFIELLEKEGAESHSKVKISSVRVENSAGDVKNVQALVLEVDAFGSCASLRNFLARVENLPYGISFDTVVLKQVESGWECDFILRTVEVKSAEATAPAPAS